MNGKTLWKLAAAAGLYATYRTAMAAKRRYDFRGRTVVITGGSRGLGLVLGRQLADEGARLAICARHQEALDRAARELRNRGATVVHSVCDVTDADAVREFLAHVRSELGAVDVLINNAGAIQVGPVETMTTQDFEQAMAVHFAGPLATMDAVIPDMRRRRQGRIVNISSIGGLVAVPHLLPYCASKFALTGLSQGLRAELAKEGILVTTVCPGLMRTGSHRRALFSGQHRLEYAWFSHGASAPLLAMAAERAARQILRACRYGRAQATLSLPGKLAALFDALAPELKSDLAAVVAGLLPGPGGVGTEKVEGRDSVSRWSPSPATLLGERAALRNNEFSSEEFDVPQP
jgi:NAD(P)-dependent dehydrogenase (short-subunit alcohol dehydrogenase family)